jgi:hypothetical protein
MTLDQVLLTALVVATVVGVIIALLRHRRQAGWRKRDLLREFIQRWAAQVGVPGEVDAVRFEEEHLRFGIDLRLAIEKDAHYVTALKLTPKRTRHLYEKFVEGRLAYIKTCHELYERIEQECAETTGLPIGHWREERSWPIRLLLPHFVMSIYQRVLGNKQDDIRLEDISYGIGPFSLTGQGFERKGLHLTVTYDAYNGLALAQADDEATLERIKSIHRQMMETHYCKRFIAEVDRIRDLRREAEILAHKVRDALRELEVS